MVLRAGLGSSKLFADSLRLHCTSLRLPCGLTRLSGMALPGGEGGYGQGLTVSWQPRETPGLPDLWFTYKR